MLKIHHRASFARHFLKPSFSSCCFHVGILFILAAFGICSWQNLRFARNLVSRALALGTRLLCTLKPRLGGDMSSRISWRLLVRRGMLRECYGGIPISRTSRGKRQIGSRNRRVREIGGKITVFDWGEGTTFASSYREVRKNEGSRNRDSTVIGKGNTLITKPRSKWVHINRTVSVQEMGPICSGGEKKRSLNTLLDRK